MYAHLRPYVGFTIRRTAAVPNHGQRSLHNESFHSRKSKCSASSSMSVVLAVASTSLLRSPRGRSNFPAVFAGDSRFVHVLDDSNPPASCPYDVARSRLTRARCRDAQRSITRERPSTSFMSTLSLHVGTVGSTPPVIFRLRPRRQTNLVGRRPGTRSARSGASEGTHTYDCLSYSRQSQALIRVCVCVCSGTCDHHNRRG